MPACNARTSLSRRANFASGASMPRGLPSLPIAPSANRGRRNRARARRLPFCPTTPSWPQKPQASAVARTGLLAAATRPGLDRTPNRSSALPPAPSARNWALNPARNTSKVARPTRASRGPTDRPAVRARPSAQELPNRCFLCRRSPADAGTGTSALCASEREEGPKACAHGAT